MEKLNILVFIKPFWNHAKHIPKLDFIKTLGKYTNITYWYEDGHINDILSKLDVLPDFIFHYDIAWDYALAPKITGLGDIDLPKGCFVIDLHWKPERRIDYFKMSKIDMIFSASKHPFLNMFPQYEDRLYWLPWSINPDVFNDWGSKKDIDYLLMGLVHVHLANESQYQRPGKIPPKGRYAFRDAVLEKMYGKPNFVFHPHPGHQTKRNEFVQKKYATELNRAKIFFTCGSRNQSGGYPVLKFFEAPACKTLLLAEPNKDIEELGFRDGVNYVACTVENIEEKATYYLLHDEKRKEITENGFQLIHQNHTSEHRALTMITQIRSFLQL